MNDQVLSEQKVEVLVRYLKWGVGLLALLAILAGIYLAIDNLAERKAQKAFSALFVSEKLEESAAKESEALKSSPEKVMLSWPEAKKKEYEAALEKVQKDFSGTVAATLAELRLGRWNFIQQKYPESEKIYSQVVKERTSKSQLLYRAMAFESWAVSLEAQNKLDQAAEVFDNALKMKDNPIKPLHYLGKARVLRAQKKDGEAKALFQKLIEEFPNTPYEKKARVLMAIGSSAS